MSRIIHRPNFIMPTTTALLTLPVQMMFVDHVVSFRYASGGKESQRTPWDHPNYPHDP